MESTSAINSKSKKIRITKRLHRYFMLLVGLQFLIWSVTGVYMVIPNIHYIHGDEWVNLQSSPLHPLDVKTSLADLLSNFPNARNIALTKQGEKSVYRFSINGQTIVVDAANGARIKPLNKNDVMALLPTLMSSSAKSRLPKNTQGTIDFQSAISDIQLITDNPPSELGATPLPLWEIKLNTWDSVSLYVSQSTGELVKVRHHLWRVFDWMWRFHIMEYNDGEDISNWLLAVTSFIAFFSTLVGLYLLYLRLSPSKSNAKMRTTDKVGV